MQITIDTNKLGAARGMFVKFLLNYFDADIAPLVYSNESEEIEVKLTPEAAFGLAPTPAEPSELSRHMENAANPVTLDKAGLPWDARIHSSNKATTADGIWRARRGVDKTLVAKVEAELRQLMGAPAAPLTFTAISAAPPPVATPPAPPPPPATNVMPAIPAFLDRTAAPTPPAPPAAPNTDQRSKFVALIGRTSAAQAAKKITPEEVAAICAQYGVTALPLLAHRLDLVDAVAAGIDALLASRP